MDRQNHNNRWENRAKMPAKENAKFIILTHSVFFNLVTLSVNGISRQFANGSQMDKTEIETYRKFLPEMEKFEIAKTGHSAMK